MASPTFRKHICIAVEIQRSLEKATAAAGIDLVVWDNDRNADTAIRNAEEMADSKVDLAIEFQLFEHVAPVISDILSRSEIPLISLVNPHHGTVYFGVNNYRAGFSAGVALADYATRHWNSHVDTLLLLESPRAGRTIQSRLVGALQGVQERLGPLPEKAIVHLDGGGDKATSQAAAAVRFQVTIEERRSWWSASMMKVRSGRWRLQNRRGAARISPSSVMAAAWRSWTLSRIQTVRASELFSFTRSVTEPIC